jgi:hypothetical protein
VQPGAVAPADVLDDGTAGHGPDWPDPEAGQFAFDAGEKRIDGALSQHWPVRPREGLSSVDVTVPWRPLAVGTGPGSAYLWSARELVVLAI